MEMRRRREKLLIVLNILKIYDFSVICQEDKTVKGKVVFFQEGVFRLKYVI